MNVASTLDLGEWPTVTLAEVTERAALLVRAEQKYTTTTAVVAEVLTQLHDAYDLLAMDGQTSFVYETVYYDTDTLRAFRDHAQGKRQRVKIRSRRYVESDVYFFEVKLKDGRARTIKKRIPYDAERHGTVCAEALEFARCCVRDVYGYELPGVLRPQLAMRFRRTTLVGRGAPERVTIDSGLEFARHGDPVARRFTAPAQTVIVETKSDRVRGDIHAGLRRAGTRPGACSKYCIGLNLVRDDLPYNRFKPVLARYFAWSGRESVGASRQPLSADHSTRSSLR